MIYNENGIIINEEYILESYFNDYRINSIINESFKDPKTKFGKTVKAAIDWLVKKIGEACQWLANVPNRAKIIAAKDDIKEVLSVYKNLNNKDHFSDIVSVAKLKGEITKYIASNGYKNGGKYIDNFSKAVEALTKNKDLSIDDVKSILYGQYGEDNWFSVSTSEVEIDSINIDEIVDFAISVNDLYKPLKRSHNDIIKFNRRLDKDAKIDIEVIKEINHYFTQAMSSIRNLSYACITVCMDIIDHKREQSDSIYITSKNKYSDDSYVKDIKDKDINELSENDQIKLIKYDINSYYKIKNPTPKIVETALKIDPDICYSTKTPHLDKKSTQAAYFAIKYLIDKDGGSHTKIVYELSYFGHDVSDTIRMLAINTEKFDDITPEDAFMNIAPFVNGKQDLNKLSDKVINVAFDRCSDYYIKTSTNDRSLVCDLMTFYNFICKIKGLEDPNEKYLRKIFDIIQKNTYIDFNAMSAYKLVKDHHDLAKFLDMFNNS